MGIGLFPILVEVATTLAFCGVLLYLRKALTARAVLFWILLWVARGVVSLFAIRYIVSSGTERLSLVSYAPLQIAFAIALVIVAMRLEGQKQQLRKLHEELARLHTQSSGHFDTDSLTGLRSRLALTRWLEEQKDFDGLVVVCDMDDFKRLNDRYGHLVGDEILHGVGKLIDRSIREEDLAFRWGGDEFVIFFHTTERELVEARLRSIEEHLQHVRLRQHGVMPVRFSWGITTTAGRPLRDSLEEADRAMYEAKRSRRLTPDPPSDRASAGV